MGRFFDVVPKPTAEKCQVNRDSLECNGDEGEDEKCGMHDRSEKVLL
jgi:hypothetical protein